MVGDDLLAALRLASRWWFSPLVGLSISAGGGDAASAGIGRRPCRGQRLMGGRRRRGGRPPPPPLARWDVVAGGILWFGGSAQRVLCRCSLRCQEQPGEGGRGSSWLGFVDVEIRRSQTGRVDGPGPWWLWCGQSAAVFLPLPSSGRLEFFPAMGSFWVGRRGLLLFTGGSRLCRCGVGGVVSDAGVPVVGATMLLDGACGSGAGLWPWPCGRRSARRLRVGSEAESMPGSKSRLAWSRSTAAASAGVIPFLKAPLHFSPPSVLLRVKT